MSNLSSLSLASLEYAIGIAITDHNTLRISQLRWEVQRRYIKARTYKKFDTAYYLFDIYWVCLLEITLPVW